MAIGGAASRPAAPLAKAGVPTTQTFHGKRIVWRDGTYVLEITVQDASLAWDPAGVSHVVVTSPGGDRVAATLDLSRTTRATTILPGEAFRIALVFERLAVEGVVAIELDLEGAHIVVALQP